MINNQYIYIGAVLLGCIAACYAQASPKPAAKCYICSPCSTTDGFPITECQPAQKYCYKEVRDDGSITRSCAVNCTEGRWTINNERYSVNCCTDKDGCNSASGFEMSAFGVLLAVVAAFEALRRI